MKGRPRRDGDLAAQSRSLSSPGCVASMKGRPRRDGDKKVQPGRDGPVLASMKGRPRRDGDWRDRGSRRPRWGLDEGPSPKGRRLLVKISGGVAYGPR